jgi:hypothetical protein
MIPSNSNLEIKRLPLDKVFVASFHDFNPEALQNHYNELIGKPTEELHPIVVRLEGDKYRVEDGRHRYMATWMAKRDLIACVIVR